VDLAYVITRSLAEHHRPGLFVNFFAVFILRVLQTTHMTTSDSFNKAKWPIDGTGAIIFFDPALRPGRLFFYFELMGLALAAFTSFCFDASPSLPALSIVNPFSRQGRCPVTQTVVTSL
jgi:hypothetical protein